jgi:hypothetical protein
MSRLCSNLGPGLQTSQLRNQFPDMDKFLKSMLIIRSFYQLDTNTRSLTYLTVIEQQDMKGVTEITKKFWSTHHCAAAKAKWIDMD